MKGTIPEKIQEIVTSMGESENAGIENGENRVNRSHVCWKMTWAGIENGENRVNRSRDHRNFDDAGSRMGKNEKSIPKLPATG